VEFAARAGNKDSAGRIAFAVFHALYNPGRLAAFRAIGALGGVHDFLAVCRFGNLSHDSIFSWDVGFRGHKLGGGKCGGKFGDGTLKRSASNHCNKMSATI
jgi:hypothetical protein